MGGLSEHAVVRDQHTREAQYRLILPVDISFRAADPVGIDEDNVV